VTHVKVTYTYTKENVVLAQMDTGQKNHPINVNLVTLVVKLVPLQEQICVLMPRQDGI